MRSKEEIQKDGTRIDLLILEVLLDTRDLLTIKPTATAVSTTAKIYTGKPRGRPKKKK